MKYSLINLQNWNVLFPRNPKIEVLEIPFVALQDLSSEDVLSLKDHKRKFYEDKKQYLVDRWGEEVLWRGQSYSYSELSKYWNCSVIPMSSLENFNS